MSETKKDVEKKLAIDKAQELLKELIKELSDFSEDVERILNRKLGLRTSALHHSQTNRNVSPQTLDLINKFKDKKYSEEYQKGITVLEKDVHDIKKIHEVLSDLNITDEIQVDIEKFDELDTFAQTKLPEKSPLQLLFQEFLKIIEPFKKEITIKAKP